MTSTDAGNAGSAGRTAVGKRPEGWYDGCPVFRGANAVFRVDIKASTNIFLDGALA